MLGAKNGELVIDYQYDIAFDFSEGLAAVHNFETDKWGFVDKNGNFIIEPIFDKLSGFSEGLALAKYNGKTLLLTYLNPYDLGYTSNQLLNTWYVTEAGVWYYFEDDRTTKKTGWYKDPEDNQMYYLDPETGIMATGWTEIDGDMYYFNDQHGNDPNWFYNAEKDIWASAGKDVKSYGSMFRDEETPDGKRVDAEGKLVE